MRALALRASVLRKMPMRALAMRCELQTEELFPRTSAVVLCPSAKPARTPVWPFISSRHSCPLQELREVPKFSPHHGLPLQSSIPIAAELYLSTLLRTRGCDFSTTLIKRRAVPTCHHEASLIAFHIPKQDEWWDSTLRFLFDGGSVLWVGVRPQSGFPMCVCCTVSSFWGQLPNPARALTCSSDS